MKNRGFTIIELLIVIAIIGVLAGIAIPNYNNFMNKSRRSDGMTALLDLQQVHARMRNNCPHYASALVDDNFDGTVDNVCDPVIADSRLEFPTTSPEGYYALAITAATANAYTATATAQSAQLGDTKCRVLTLTVSNATPNGGRTSTDADGNASTGCW